VLNEAESADVPMPSVSVVRDRLIRHRTWLFGARLVGARPAGGGGSRADLRNQRMRMLEQSRHVHAV
jgi:hypothetical protein